jgi:agmatine deiminase
MKKEECDGLAFFDGEPTRTEGERLAASYVNFYISNGAIIMPAFGDDMDKAAADKLASLFTDREIIQIYARDILIGGGNIHCITQQIPQ